MMNYNFNDDRINELAIDLDTCINTWLQDNEFYDIEARFSTDFEYAYKEDIVYYSIFVPQAHDDWFIDVCKRCEPRIEECDSFILSLFHEIGHSETLHTVTDEEWSTYEQFVNQPIDKDTKQAYYDYYTHPVELCATQWGSRYIADHYVSVKKLFLDIKSILMKFYDDMEVDINE